MPAITIDQLKQLAVDADNAALFVGPLNGAMNRFHINDTVRRQAAFLAQVIHESNGFRSLSENMNYSVSGLLATWPSRFTSQTAAKYGRTNPLHPADQESIANIAYANRMGNGDAKSGDGWRYRGRGPIQITGKDNYAACGKALELDLLSNPSLLTKPTEGCLSAAWFWDTHNLNMQADAGNIDVISRAINGGDLGLAMRRSLYEQTLKVLA